MKILQLNANHPSKYNLKKGALVFVMVLEAILPFHNHADIVNDPALTGAVIVQTEELKDFHKKRNRLREATITAQGFITAGLEEIHRIECQVLEYMQNASGVLTNMSQVANIGITCSNILDNTIKLTKAIPDNPQGAAITALVSTRVATTIADAQGLASLVSSCVSSEYSFSDEKKDPGKKHVNLLSSAERFNILLDVQRQLNRINRDLRLLRYYVKSLGFRELWKGLDRKSYMKTLQIMRESHNIADKWNKLTK